MTTEKVAAVRLTLNPRGFVAGFRTAEGAVNAGSKRMQGRLGLVGASLRGWLNTIKAAGGATRDMAKNVIANPYGSMLAGLKALESRSKATFRRIGQAAKAAYGGLAEKLFGKQGGGRDEKGRFLAGGKKNKEGPGAFAIAGAQAIASMIQGGIGRVKGVVENAGSVEEKAAQIAVTGRKSGQAAVDPKQLEAEFYAVANAVKGTLAEDAADAAARYQTLTGDLDVARRSLVDFAHVAKATGGKMGDVAEATGSIAKQFGITNPDDIRKALASLTFQGKAGAIELPDLAVGLQKLAAAGAAFGMSKDVSGVQKLGALTQMARAGTGNREQAFTAVESLFKSLLEKSPEFKRARVNVYEGKGASMRTRGIQEIITDAIANVGGGNLAKKQTELGKLFDVESMRMLNPLISQYMTAYRGASGADGKPATDRERKAAGVEALKKAFAEAENAAGGWSDVVADSTMMQQTNSAKVTASIESMKAKIADSVLPKLGEFVDKITDSEGAIDAIVFGLEFLAWALEQTADGLKALGLIKGRTKTSLEFRDEAQAKADAATKELKAMQMRPEEIQALEKSDPAELARRRKAAGDKQIEATVAQATAAHWERKAWENPFAWDDTNAPTTRGGKSKLAEKFETARQQVGGSAVGAPSAAEAAKAREQAASTAAAAPKQKGPIEVRPTGVQRVHIIADDSGKGAGASLPAPARAPRR